MDFDIPRDLTEREIQFIYDFIDAVEDESTEDLSYVAVNKDGKYVAVDPEEVDVSNFAFIVAAELVSFEDYEYFTEEDYRETFKRVLPVLMDVYLEYQGEKIYMIQGAQVTPKGIVSAEINETYVKLLELDREFGVLNGQ